MGSDTVRLAFHSLCKVPDGKQGPHFQTGAPGSLELPPFPLQAAGRGGGHRADHRRHARQRHVHHGSPWPASLPHDRKAPQLDAGPAAQRPRAQAGPVPLQCVSLCDKEAQLRVWLLLPILRIK